MHRTVLGAFLLAVAGLPAPLSGDIVLENARVRALLGEDAAWRSFIDKATRKEYLPAGQRVYLAAVRIGNHTHPACRARLSGRLLEVGFSDTDTRLSYDVITAADWIALRLSQIEGTRPSHVTLLRLAVTITEHCGSRLNAAWNEAFAIGLRGINLQSEGFPSRQRAYTLLGVTSQDGPGPKLEGAGAAILASPTAELKPILARFSAAFDLPRNEAQGVPSKDLPLARQSYWFLGFGEKDADRVIDYCRKTGIRQVMLNSGSWCASVGHFTFRRDTYPDGMESLRRTVARLHHNGILVGMHTFASKVSKTDPYVTPIPSRGFWVDRSATLAQDIRLDDSTIRTKTDLSQWPGSPVCQQKVWEGHVSKHQEVILDDEIIRYESIGPEGRWDTFLGCQRGTWGTRPAPHAAGTECRHYGVDGCINGYILDQEHPLFQETTSRLAEVFNTCDFDMVYFDGSEDVDRRRYHYYSSNAHAVAMSKFRKRPVIHTGGGFTHGLWHSYTRANTVDQYPGTYLAHLQAGGTIDKWPTCKDHIDRSVRGALACQDDMTPGELGWFGIGPRSGKYDGLQFDEVEYLMCKSLAYDAPISLQTSFARMEAHPLTPDILEIIRRYEELRMAGTVPAATRKRLEAQGRDFLLLPDPLQRPAMPPEFVEVKPLAQVAGTHDVRAWVGGCEGGAVAAVWHFVGQEGQLFLNVPNLAAYDARGNRVETQRRGESIGVPVGARRIVLHAAGRAADALAKALAEARLELRQPTVLWIQAEDCLRCVGTMTKGANANIRDPEAFGDVVLCNGPVDRFGRAPCYCEYRVHLPRKGRWTLWARVRYPTGGDMSFAVAVAGEKAAPAEAEVLGNCGQNAKRWHWTGRGGGVTTAPPGSPIVFAREEGEFIFRIHPREGSGIAATNPRLDCLCLSEDPGYLPSDRDVPPAFLATR